MALWDEGLVCHSVCMNRSKVKGGWTAFQMRVAMAGSSGFPSSSAVRAFFKATDSLALVVL